jgi:hypothetical protein
MRNVLMQLFHLLDDLPSPTHPPPPPPPSTSKLLSGTIRVKNSCRLQVTVYWHYLLKIKIKKQYNPVTLPVGRVANSYNFEMNPDPAVHSYADRDPGLTLIPSQRRPNINFDTVATEATNKNTSKASNQLSIFL